MKRKILSILLVLLMCPVAVYLSACFTNNNPSFKSSSAVSNDTNVIIENLTTKAYNASVLEKSTEYTVAELKEKINDIEYYVEIGSVENIDDIESIMVGSSTFNKGQEFNLSIGNANYIKDKAYYLENNKLFVAAPIIAFEMVNNAKIKINNSEFDLNLDKSAEIKSFSNAQFSAATNQLEKVNNNEYNLTFKDAKTYLKLYYDNAAADDVILTKKVLTNSGDDKVNGTVNYGLTKVENQTNNPLGFYPIGYSSNALDENWKTKYDGAKMEYEAYVIDGGIYKTRLNFSIELAN